MKGGLKDHYLQNISLVNTGNNEIFHNGLGFKFLELPKFDKKEGDLENELDKWVYMLKHMHSLNQIPKYLDKRIFQKIFKIAEMGRLSAEQQFLYESSLMHKADYENTIEYAAERGLEQGLEKGLEQGLEKGIRQNAIEIAKKMKSENFDFVKIARFTELTIEEIEKL